MSASDRVLGKAEAVLQVAEERLGEAGRGKARRGKARQARLGMAWRGEATRKLLGHWNIDLLYRRMADKAEQNRVFLAFVEPAYSSQTCNSCRAIDKKSSH